MRALGEEEWASLLSGQRMKREDWLEWFRIADYSLSAWMKNHALKENHTHSSQDKGEESRL